MHDDFKDSIIVAIVMVSCFLLVAWGVSCERKSEEAKIKKEEKRIIKVVENIKSKSSIDNLVTIGNNSYIRLNTPGDPDTKVRIILETIQNYELRYPKHTILNWKIEKQQNAHSSTDPYIFGIWIHFKKEI